MARLSTSLHPKLTDSTILILCNKKINTVLDLMAEDSDKIMQYSGLTYQEVLELKRSITKLYIGGIKKGNELLKDAYNGVIQTGIPSLDDLLKGGLSGGQIYEICGLSSSGKSQLSHTVAVNVAHNALQNYGVVHYIDTKGDFCAKRILSILMSKDLTEEEQGLIVDNVIVTRIESYEELMNFLHNLKNNLRLRRDQNQKQKMTKLVIIDSLPAIFFKPDPNFIINIYGLNHLANILRCIANEFNIPVITVNLISQWREYGSDITGFKNPMISKSGLGKHWASVPNTRILMEAMKFEKRRLTVWKSSSLLKGSNCKVHTSNFGIC